MIKATGILFVMSSLSDGCRFKERFALLENGKLNIFKSEKDYLNFNSTVMKPFHLNQYRVVSTLREVEETSMAPKGSKLSSFFGSDSSLSLSSSMRKDVNLQSALTKCRFNLVPKVIIYDSCTILYTTLFFAWRIVLIMAYFQSLICTGEL